MLTITGGTLKGKRFSVPASWPIRPTTALTREAFFQRISAVLPGCRFLDLFTGSGLMALEAISRGAGYAIAIDANRQHCQRLVTLVTQWQVPLKVVHRKAEVYLQKPPDIPYDVVFMDPPYSFSGWSLLLPLLTAWTHTNSIIVIEHDKFTCPNAGETRWYGNTALTWLTRHDLNMVFTSNSMD
jgi:16S rRNA (guanine966-N2)-methyltransferase